MEAKFYKIKLGDNVQVVEAAKAMEIADQMVKAAGGGVPDIKPCDEHGNLLEPQEKETELTMTEEEKAVLPPGTKLLGTIGLDDKPNASPVVSDWSNPVVDNSAKTRIENLHTAIAKAGGPKIDTTKQFFATGTRMAKIGYDTQRQREQEHLAMPLLVEAIEQLQETVSNEVRRDFKLTSKEIANLIEVEDNTVYVKEHSLTEHAVRGIITRLGSPAIGYLLGLQERVAAESLVAGADQDMIASDINTFAEILRYECLRNPDVEFKLRMREYPRDIYAALSPTFGAADAPMVMEQILEQMPKDARGSWDYNQNNTSWELKASIWTPVAVDEQAVGEPFEGYVSLSSRDNGTGRFNGGGGINLLRCLNASTYSAGDALSRTHRGNKVLFDVKGMIAKSLKAISVLCQAWGKGRKEEVEIPAGLTLEQAMPGFWRHLLKEGELVGVLAGKKENHVAGLTKAYFDQRRDADHLVRADFAQGWTRYIQNQPKEVQREGELAIGSWMVKPPKHIRCDLKDSE